MGGPARKAAILGGGQRGAGWAARFVLNGWDVAVFDPDPGVRDAVVAVVDAARSSLPALSDLPMPAEGGLHFTNRISETVENADWIAECAPERIDLKRKLYQQVQSHCRAGTVIASASGRFTATVLQSCATRPEQIVLAHAATPVYLMPLVELSGGSAASEAAAEAAEVLRELGMAPVSPALDTDGNIAGRLTEALWREALWLVAEGIATPADIDAALCHGPALTWAVSGAFEAGRLAGGTGGIAASLDGSRIDLDLPRSHLADAPPLDDALAARIAAATPATLDPALRDGALVGVLRALKDRDTGAGRTLNAHDDTRRSPDDTPDLRAVAAPLSLWRMQVLPAWIDANGHMNESRYLLAVSETTELFLRGIGVDRAYIDSGFSYYTVETHLRHLAETRLGDWLTGTVQVLGHDGKRLHLFVRVLRDNVPMATAEQMLIHVNRSKGRSAPAPEAVLDRLRPLARAHADLPAPDGVGRRIGDPAGD